MPVSPVHVSAQLLLTLLCRPVYTNLAWLLVESYSQSTRYALWDFEKLQPSSRNLYNLSQTTLYAFKMAATLYAFKIKSVLFQRDFSLEFEAYVSKQNPYFFAAKEPTLAKLSHNLTMRESYTLRAKFTANAPEFIANVGRGVVALSIDACMPDTGLKSHYKLLGPMDVVL